MLVAARTSAKTECPEVRATFSFEMLHLHVCCYKDVCKDGMPGGESNGFKLSVHPNLDVKTWFRNLGNLSGIFIGLKLFLSKGEIVLGTKRAIL